VLVSAANDISLAGCFGFNGFEIVNAGGDNFAGGFIGAGFAVGVGFDLVGNSPAHVAASVFDLNMF